MNNNDKLCRFFICEESSNIFSSDDKYTVPLYQREYAWGDTQIEQLVDDINDNTESNYYIGSLIVHKREKNIYEVIDGQQRLTTLFLLLSFLELKVKNNLSFDCRKKSNSTLSAIVDKRQDYLKDEDCEQSILSGFQIISDKFKNNKINRHAFLEKLKNVVLYRIEVPEGTDLNRYFEIMNTRGQQLEQHDILKASFMSKINDNKNRDLFAKIWEACADMTGYVQMHFTDVNMRKNIFSENWNCFSKKIFNYTPDLKVENTQILDKLDMKHELDRILQSNPNNLKTNDGENENNERVRFESIISFPYFLQHVLRVFAQIKKLKLNLPEQLDDKKIVKNYDLLLKSEQFDSSTTPFDFGYCLLKCRFLFDKYIIKREFKAEDILGEWSLKQLNKSESSTPYYTQTQGFDNDTNLKMQSAMRVSYTSPKVMHWITALLTWIYENSERLSDYENITENIIKQAVKDNFLNIENKNMGVETPHIVFNYLDFLLWKEDKQKYADFTFEFRNSVEHWYPQHPSGESFEIWKQEDLDNFGNLCIIQRNINARFSNMSPLSKKSTFKDMIAKGSLKLRLMADKTLDDAVWKKNFDSLGKEWIKKLKFACYA